MSEEKVKAYHEKEFRDIVSGFKPSIDNFLKEHGDVMPAFFIRSQSKGNVIIASDFNTFSDDVSKRTFLATVLAVSSSIDDLESITNIVASYILDVKNEDLIKEAGTSNPEDLYHFVREKYGAFCDSPYGKEVVTVAHNAGGYHAMGLFDVIRIDDDAAYVKGSLNDVCIEVVGADSSDRMGGHFSHLFDKALAVQQTELEMMKRFDGQLSRIQVAGIVLKKLLGPDIQVNKDWEKHVRKMRRDINSKGKREFRFDA